MICVLEMLEEQAEKRPEKTAFSDPEGSIAFSELLTLSKKSGTMFLDGSFSAGTEAKKRFRVESAVAFYMEKCTDVLPVMFGAVYAGGFYSFVDVRQPGERVLEILRILEPACIITDEENKEALLSACEASSQAYTVCLLKDFLREAEKHPIDEAALSAARKGFTDTSPLYVNFTSGSTGIPKGVAVGHRSVIDFISDFAETFSITETDILANQAPFDFDVSVKDIYSGLYTGAEVVLIPRPYFSDPMRLMDYLAAKQVTTLIWAVSAMCFVSIMNGLAYKTPETIRKIMFSGELMPVKQLNKWKQYLPDALYVNLYGPTEITCNCTYYILDREFENDELIPVGIPFRNEKVFLLDDNNGLAEEPGCEGEICVGGTCLAIGYYKDFEKTAEVFVQNPLNDRFTERIYRTGDIGRYDANGNLVYLTRKDFQIKHLGQRIELPDIEVSAMSIEGVERACALYDQKRKRILLYYTGELEKEKLSEGLQNRLPPFMLPNRTIQLSEMPLNKNGKIDRKALSEKG